MVVQQFTTVAPIIDVFLNVAIKKVGFGISGDMSKLQELAERNQIRDWESLKSSLSNFNVTDLQSDYKIDRVDEVSLDMYCHHHLGFN